MRHLAITLVGVLLIAFFCLPCRAAAPASITRGRERNHVYAVAAQGPAARPADDLRRALAVSTAKQTAHDRGGLGL